jgi:hypothetical protein
VRVGGARARDQREPHEVVAREAPRIVQRQVGHDGHAVVLDLPVAQRAGLVGVVGDERAHQVGPVRRDARRAVLRHVLQEGLALLRVGAREHAAVGAQPFHAGHAVQRRAVGLPAGGVGAPEAVEDLLRLRKAQVVRAHLQVEQHHVDVEEEVQVAMDHLQRDGRIARAGHHAHGRDVVAAEDAHRRIAVRPGAVGRAAGAPLAVQKALHVGQEAHELVVVPLVEAAAVAGVFVDLLAPRRGVAHVAQQLPGAMVRALRALRARVGLGVGRGVGRGHQPHGPQQRLPEMLHRRGAGGRTRGECVGLCGHGGRGWVQHGPV